MGGFPVLRARSLKPEVEKLQGMAAPKLRSFLIFDFEAVFWPRSFLMVKTMSFATGASFGAGNWPSNWRPHLRKNCRFASSFCSQHLVGWLASVGDVPSDCGGLASSQGMGAACSRRRESGGRRRNYPERAQWARAQPWCGCGLLAAPGVCAC